MTGPFHVSASGLLRAEIRRLHEVAVRQGRARAFRTALRQINQRLEVHPSGFGEPIYHLTHKGFEVRKASIRPVAVAYAIIPEKREVVLRNVHLMDE